jgi:hypothetical protein
MKNSPAKAQRRKGRLKNTRFVLLCVFLCAFAPLREKLFFAAQARPSPLDLDTPDFKLRLTKESQTVAALEPKNTPGFDFTPSDRLSQRAANGYHHLGDLILRVRAGNSGPWLKYDTAESRAPVMSLIANDPTLVAADLSPTLPADVPLRIIRSWIIDNGSFVLRFDLKNKSSQSVQLGALGIPMIFNNILTGRSLKEAHAPDFKYDPTIDWTTWTSWKKADAESIKRGYNYPHVIAAYWSMYRLARNHQGLVTNHSWEWYLNQANETARFMFGRQEDGRRRVGYVDLGLMEGDILVALLEDLKRESWTEKAQTPTSCE